MNITTTVTVQIYGYINIRLFRDTAHLCLSLTGKKELCHLIPVFGSQCTDIFQAFTGGFTTGRLRFQHVRILLQENSAATQILRQFHIRSAVAYHKTIHQVVIGISKILRQHTCARLTGWRIVFGHTTVYTYIIERNSFAFQGFHHQVMCRPKSFFRKRCCTQPILIGNHYKLKIQFAAYKAKITHYFRIKLQFFQRIQLIIHRWFNNQRSVTIYKKYFLHIFLNASSSFSFSNLVPTVTLKQFPQSDTELRLRTMIPSPTR